MTTSIKIPISAIVLDESTQCRAEMRQEVIDEYAERMAEGDVFPPIDVFGTREKSWPGDGWHRLLAARLNTYTDIEVVLHPGGRTEAIKWALAANAAHGLKRSNGDKHRAVDIALREFPKLSGRAIAELCGVGYDLVQRVKKVTESVTCDHDSCYGCAHWTSYDSDGYERCAKFDRQVSDCGPGGECWEYDGETDPDEIIESHGGNADAEPQTVVGRDGKTYPATRSTGNVTSSPPTDPDDIPGFREGDSGDHTTSNRKGLLHTETHDVSDAEQFVNMAIRQLERIRDDDPNADKELARVSEWIANRRSRP